MIQNVSFEKTTFNELPFKFEAGTPDYIGTTALAKRLIMYRLSEWTRLLPMRTN